MPKKLLSLAQAVATADNTLLQVSKSHLLILTSNQPLTNVEKQQRLIRMGELAVARHELEWLRSNAQELRRSCAIAKGAEIMRQIVLERIKSSSLVFSAIAADMISRLPDFAAEIAEESRNYEIDWPESLRTSMDEIKRKVMLARGSAERALEKLNQMPAQLARIVELVEAGDFQQARALLN